MTTYKAIELIQKIPKKNMPFLKDFLLKNTITPVYKVLQYALNDHQEEHTDKEIWSITFGKNQFKKHLFANYCHQLQNSVEQAICLISLKEKNLSYYDLLLPTLLDWDLLDHYQFSFKKANKQLTKAIDHDYFSFYKHRFEYLQFIALEKESSRKVDLNINAASDSLDEYYILLKLRYLCAAASHQRISAAQYKVNFIEELIPTIARSNFINTPLIKNYLLVNDMLKDYDSNEGFLKLKQQLKQDRLLFSDSELNEIYIYPINFCIQKLNSGALHYRTELLDIYKSLPGFNVDSTEIISPWRFRNVIHLALMERDYSWAEYFLTNFSHRLLPEYRENAVTYNMANLRFHEKKYKDVIPLLIHVEYKDINYALICKILLLKTYFEMDELDAFHSLLESFRLFITRTRDLSSSQRKKYLDLLSIMRKLAKMEFANATSIDKFKTRIKAKDIIADKVWILEKLETL